jgi:hypothetical protein
MYPKMDNSKFTATPKLVPSLEAVISESSINVTPAQNPVVNCLSTTTVRAARSKQVNRATEIFPGRLKDTIFVYLSTRSSACSTNDSV